MKPVTVKLTHKTSCELHLGACLCILRWIVKPNRWKWPTMRMASNATPLLGSWCARMCKECWQKSYIVCPARPAPGAGQPALQAGPHLLSPLGTLCVAKPDHYTLKANKPTSSCTQKPRNTGMHNQASPSQFLLNYLAGKRKGIVGVMGPPPKLPHLGFSPGERSLKCQCSNSAIYFDPP